MKARVKRWFYYNLTNPDASDKVATVREMIGASPGESDTKILLSLVRDLSLKELLKVYQFIQKK